MKPRYLLPAMLATALSMTLAACGKDQPPPADGSYAGGLPDAQQPQWPQPPPGAQGDGGMLASAPGAATVAVQGLAPGQLPPLRTDNLQQVQIIDRNGFGQPMVVADVEIPVGWQTVGGVSWNDATNCIANQFQMGWTAMAPDSLTALEILPGFNWQVQGTQIQMNPCPAAPFRTTREFLEATVQRTRPAARVLDYQQLPEVERKMAQAGQQNPQARVRHDAGRLLIGYSNSDGVEMREVLSAAVSFSEAQGNVVAGTATIHALRAPSGRLDLELTQRIADSMKPNMQWMEAMKQRSMANLQRYTSDQRNSINDWHNRQMAIINARGAADRHAIRMRTNQEVAGIYNAVAVNTGATDDAIHRRSVDGINEVNRHAGTEGSQVVSSIHSGSRVFQDDNVPERAYSTNDPYHAPTNATELEPIP